MDYFSSDNTFDSCCLSTTQDMWKPHCTPGNVIFFFILASFVLEKTRSWKEKKRLIMSSAQWAVMGGVGNVYQGRLMRKTAASGRAACKVMRQWGGAGPGLWSLHLVQELCWGNKGERHRPPSHSLPRHKKVVNGSRTEALLSSASRQHTPGFRTDRKCHVWTGLQ